jgi:hypothetical protein
MTDETENKKDTSGMLGEELLRELKLFLIDKPNGHQYIRRFVQEAVREKIAKMKAEGSQ